MQKIEDLRVKKENLEIHYEDWINNENTNTVNFDNLIITKLTYQ